MGIGCRPWVQLTALQLPHLSIYYSNQGLAYYCWGRGISNMHRIAVIHCMIDKIATPASAQRLTSVVVRGVLTSCDDTPVRARCLGASPHRPPTITPLTPTMTASADDDTAPSFRFKRRRTTHTKRARTDDDAPDSTNTHTLDATSATNAPEAAQVEQESAPNLKAVLRGRKRPRDHMKEVKRGSEAEPSEVGKVDAPQTDRYTSRFIAQTGQVVDSGDAQM